MADTFAALSRDPDALQATIEETPPTLDRHPLVPGAAPVPGRLRRPLGASAPRGAGAAATRCRRSTPALADRHAGAPAQCRAHRPPRRRCSARSRTWARTRNTLLAHPRPGQDGRRRAPGHRVHRAVPDGLQLRRLLLQPARRAHRPSQQRRHVERVLLKQADPRADQPARRPAPRTARWTPPRQGGPAGPNPPASLHTQYGGPAIDSNGRADCQAGQTGYPDRPSPASAIRPRRTPTRAAAHTWCSTPTRPACAAARSSPASLASTP